MIAKLLPYKDVVLWLLFAAGFVLVSWRLEIAKVATAKAKLETAEHDRDRFKDALAFYVADGQIRIGRGHAALKEQEARSAETHRRIDRIRTAKPSADCTTAREVMEAGL